METPIRVAIYARIKPEQAAKAAQERQKALLLVYAAKEKLVVDGSSTDNAGDPSDSYAGLSETMDIIKHGSTQPVVAREVACFSRNAAIARRLISMVEQAGGQVFRIQQDSPSQSNQYAVERDTPRHQKQEM